ncbi:hypothetical protein B1H19_29035 [Streptomyces gilvosporeus]|uniref:Uncharacterized protein n=1 Tax=Streptomyces gilvosporeus TaxID=553510 RepID=A0A1V0TXT6_9ACTN|nr:hypothetical protein B1H19_29035 [Streptomyces gilvosporeus]
MDSDGHPLGRTAVQAPAGAPPGAGPAAARSGHPRSGARRVPPSVRTPEWPIRPVPGWPKPSPGRPMAHTRAHARRFPAVPLVQPPRIG